MPFAISGGDRDGDGMDAEIESTLAIEDMDDACTVFEINSFANIAPQYHHRFNGSGGLWFKLESAVRSMVDAGADLTIIAGTVFDDGQPVQRIGRRGKGRFDPKIGVPHGFFKVVYNNRNGEKTAYLFDHQADLKAGCGLDTTSIAGCRVDLESIEGLTGLTLDLQK